MVKRSGNLKGLREEVQNLQAEGSKLEAQYNASHTALYGVLEHAHDVLTRATNEDQVEELVALSEKWAKKTGHTFRPKSDAPLRLVYMVFAGAAKQRLNNYANVLRAAPGRDPKLSVAEWISSKGGVQEISYSVAAPINAEEKQKAMAQLIADVAAIEGTETSIRARSEEVKGRPFVMFGFVRDDLKVISISQDLGFEVIRPFALKAVKRDKALKKHNGTKQKPQPEKKPETMYDKFFFEAHEGTKSVPAPVAEKKVA